MFDTLEVFLKHDSGCDRQAHIAALSSAIEPRFSVSALELVHDLETDETCQIVRFATDREAFPTAEQLEAAVMEILEERTVARCFSWLRAGALRVGQRHLTCALRK